VVCQGFEACRDATITCPQTYDCAVDCAAGDSACRKVLVTCADGPCALSCGPEQNICNDAEVTCGANSCAAECDPSGPGGNKKPNVNCGDACSCQSC
jgi:hypothetical protein